MKPNKERIESREIECHLSADELRARAETLAHTIQFKTQLQLEKKEAFAGFKQRIDACDKDIISCSNAINTSAEIRTVDCTVLLNEPEDGKKTIFRKDTGESWLEDMTASEIQEEIDF